MTLNISVSSWSEVAQFPLLTTLTLVPLIATIAVCHANSKKQAWIFAYFGAGINVLLSGYVLWLFDDNKQGIQLAEQFDLLGIIMSSGTMVYSVRIVGMSITSKDDTRHMRQKQEQSGEGKCF